MSVYRLQITAGPTTGAAVHADLSTDDVGVLGESFSLGSAGASFDAAGFPVERAREVSMEVRIQKGANVGTVMQQVARAVSVPDRWLLIQRTHDTDPVWFKIHPTSPGTLSMHTAWTDAHGGDSTHGFWTWSLSLLTDSTAVGERRAIVPVGASSSTVTVPNSGTSRGVVIDAPGEAPTPLRITALPSQVVNGTRVLVSTYSVPWDSPLVTGGEPSIIMDDTAFYYSEELADRATGKTFLSGGTGISMPMNVTDYRVWARGPGAGGPSEATLLEPGRYLVLARLYREGAAGQVDVRMSQQWGSQDAWQEWRSWRPTAGFSRSSWMPVGYLNHPYGGDGAGLLPEEIKEPQIRIAARVTEVSSSTMYLDQVAYVPVDLTRGSCEAAMFSHFEPGVGADGPLGISWVFDAEHRAVRTVDAFGMTHSSPSPLRAGGWPVAVPGMATGVSIFLDTSDATSDLDQVQRTTDLTVECSPRMLHVGRER